MVGKSHPALKRLRALRRDGSARAADGVLVAEGIHLAEEALASGAAIELAVHSPRLPRVPGGEELLRGLADRARTLLEAPEETLEKIQDARAPQPVVLVVRFEPPPLEEIVRGRGGAALLVIADGIQDPGNLGSLLRSADAAGATGFLAAEGSADLAHPRVVRATMGSIFRLPSASARGEALRGALRAAGIPLVATASDGEVDYDAYDWREPAAVVFGAEGPGIRAEWLRAANATVRIPMREGVESLSVPAAGAVVLFEAARRRRKVSGG